MAIFSKENKMRLLQKMDTLMSLMHSQIKRALSSAINDRIIPEIQKIVSSLTS